MPTKFSAIDAARMTFATSGITPTPARDRTLLAAAQVWCRELTIPSVRRLAAEVGRSPVTILRPFKSLIRIYAEVIRREWTELDTIGRSLPHERTSRLERHVADLRHVDPVLERLPALVQAAVVGALSSSAHGGDLDGAKPTPGVLPFSLEAVTSAELTVAELQGSLRDQILDVAYRHNARSIAVFGSVARGEAGADSDVDFLVEFNPGSTLLDLVHLSQDLEALLGRRVDVVSRGALKRRDVAIANEAIAL